MGKEIPGFYFDESTNRYFALRPGQSPPVKEKEVVKNVEDEEVQKERLDGFLRSWQLGSLPVRRFQRDSSICMIQNTSAVRKLSESQDQLPDAENFASSSNLDHLPHFPYMLQWSNHSYQIMMNYYNKRDKTFECGVLDQQPINGGSLTHACFGNFNVDQLHFMIAISGDSNTNGRCIISEISRGSDELRAESSNEMHFESKQLSTLVAYKKTLYSCFWQPKSTLISLGVTKGCTVWDGFTCKMIGRYSMPADVLKQQISESGIIFNGLRGGKIEQVDPRSGEGRKSILLGNLKPRFCPIKFYGLVNPVKMKLFRDETYLLVSYTDGRVLLWDRRKNDVLFRYGSSAKAFCTNHQEDLLYTVNNDKEVLTWDIWKQNLVNQADPLPVSVAPVSVVYSDIWPLYDPDTRRFSPNETNNRSAALCSYYQYRENPFVVHSLFQ